MPLLSRFILALAFCATCVSCLWDRDTLREESSRDPDLVKIIVGWFDRYPPEYYEHRIARVEKELREKPEDLALYDDIAVALDRVGRPGEAIGWMVKKKAQLDAAGLVNEADAHYKYLANLGTFYVHRWLMQKKAGEETDQLNLVEANRLIAKCIELNPDAHFGREKYQLMAIRYLLKGGELSVDVFSEHTRDLRLTHPYPRGKTDKGEAIVGWSGLVTLGAAWKSELIFREIRQLLLHDGQGYLAAMASLRVQEIRDPESLVALEDLKGKRVFSSIGGRQTSAAEMKQIHEYYCEARAASDARQEAMHDYVRGKISAGQHPDTHQGFWDGWNEPDFPKPSFSLKTFFWQSPFLIGAVLACLPFVFLYVHSFRKARKKRQATA